MTKYVENILKNSNMWKISNLKFLMSKFKKGWSLKSNNMKLKNSTFVSFLEMWNGNFKLNIPHLILGKRIYFKKDEEAKDLHECLEVDFE